ncbi:MAG: prepilin-type N-terminal cleavage/methylation domain-containing protein [Gemmatimonadales bacterium]
MRDGFTLPELVVAIALVAILTGITVPALVTATDRSAIRMGLAQLRGAHEEARLAAVLADRTAVLTVTRDSLTLRTILGADTVVNWKRVGPAGWGVELIGAGRSFRFSPLGYSIGVSNATLRLKKGSASGSLTISRLGRVRVAMQ